MDEMLNISSSGENAISNENSEFDLSSMTFDQVMATNICICLGEITKKDYSYTYAVYNFAVVILLIPLIALFGIVSNFVNIYVFTRRRMTVESTNIYLLFLACSDLFVVIGGLFIFCLDSLRSYVPAITTVATTSALWVMPAGYVAQTCSVYCTVGAAANCYAKFCRPLSRVTKRLCKPGASRLLACAIIFFSASYNSLRFWLFYLHQCHDAETTATVELCPSRLYFKIYLTYTVYMYTLLMVFVPFTALMALNALIVAKLRVKKNMPLDVDRSVIDNRLDEVPNVKPLVMVVVLFLSCNFLALVSNIVEAFFQPDALTINFLNDTSNLLVIFNSSVNFVIYIVYDPDYRKSFLRAKSATSKHSSKRSSLCRTKSKELSSDANQLSLLENGDVTRNDSWHYFSLNGTPMYNCYGNRLSMCAQKTYVAMPKTSVDFGTNLCFHDNHNISPESDL